jgi:hypothetical protein
MPKKLLLTKDFYLFILPGGSPEKLLLTKKSISHFLGFPGRPENTCYMSFLKNPENPENPEITPKGGFENSQLPTGLGILQDFDFLNPQVGDFQPYPGVCRFRRRIGR